MELKAGLFVTIDARTQCSIKFLSRESSRKHRHHSFLFLFWHRKFPGEMHDQRQIRFAQKRDHPEKKIYLTTINFHQFSGDMLVSSFKSEVNPINPKGNPIDFPV